MLNKSPNRIKKIRLDKGMTLQEVANKSGITTDPAQIQKLERGLRSLTPKWLKAISTALGVEPYELLPSEWQPKPDAENIKMIGIPLVGSIAEGIWQQGLKFFPKSSLLIAYENEQVKYQPVYTNRPENFTEDQLFAFEVQDDTLQSFYARGTVLVCVKKKEYGSIENGKRVVCIKVDRQMHASQIFVRRYMNTDDQELLFNDLPEHIGVEIARPEKLEILGVIIKSIRNE